MWDADEAKRRAAKRSGLSEKEIAEAEQAAAVSNRGPIGAQIRELFESKEIMAGAMQTMDLTNDHFQRAFIECSKVDDDVSTRAVSLGLMMNLVMILRVIERKPEEVLDICSRAIELSELFKDAMLENGGKNPFRNRHDD